MKKILFILGIIGLSLTYTACGDDDDNSQTITLADLPAAATSFLNTHFTGVTPTLIIKDNDSYDVFFERYKVEFNIDGTWDAVEGTLRDKLPQSILNLLPPGIDEYISANHKNSYIVDVDKEVFTGSVAGYEIKLNDNLNRELEFDEAGTFLRYDD